MGSAHVFISYARAEPQWAERLDQDLVARGYSVWRDVRGIPDGYDFTSVIEEAISAASHMLVCLTPSISHSPTSFVRREVQWALLLADPRFGPGPAPIVIPVVLPKGRPLVHIATLSFVVIANEGDYARGLQEIVQRLKGSLPSLPSSPPRRDPRTEYLRSLYDWCSKTLARTVAFTIELVTREAADAVEARQAAFVPRFAISAAFPSAPAPSSSGDIREVSLTSEFDKGGSVLLIGAPAAGKTTALLALTRSLAVAALESPDAAIPCLASIPTWDGRSSLLDWLETQTPAEVRGLPKILLLDGLDELGGPRREDPEDDNSPMFDPRVRFLDWLERELPGARVVISTRKADYEEMSRRARLGSAIELLPLDESQIRAYVEGCEKPWLADLIAGDPSLREIVRSPLLLAMLTAAIEAPSDLEHGWSRNKVIDAWFTRVLRHEVSRPSNLGATGDASAALSETTRAIERHAMRRVLEPLEGVVWGMKLPEPGKPAALELAERVKLLRRSREGTLEFAHLLLLDHFAMPGLAEFCVGLDEDDSWGLASAIVQSVGARAADFVVDFARRATSESVKMLATSMSNVDDPAYVPALLAFDHHNTAATDIVANACFTRLGERAIEPLRSRLLGPEEHLRNRAAARLAGIAPKGVAVLAAATSNARPSVRRAALTGLARIRQAVAADCARAHIADPDASVRAAALNVVALSAPGSLGDLLLPLFEDEKVDVRRAAADAIGTTCSPAIEAALTAHLDSEHDEWTRAAFARALAKCGSVDPVLRLLRADDASDLLVGALEGAETHLPTETLASLIREHPNQRIREGLCYLLKGRADAAALLTQVLRQDPGPYVRVAAARALTAIGGEAVVSTLSDALLAGHPVDFWAVSGLEEIDSDAAARALWHAVESRRASGGDPPEANSLGLAIERALTGMRTPLAGELLAKLPWK